MLNRRSRVLAAAVTSASLVLLSSSVITGVAHAAAGSTIYEAESSTNALAGGATVIACAPCSGGDRVGNIGVGGTLIFNGVTEAAAGSYQVVVAGTQDQGRTLTAYISVNGGVATKVLFNRTASWTTVEDVTVPMTLKAGTNTIEISNPSKNAPDIDAITVPGGTAVGGDFSVSDSPASGSVAAGSSTTTTVSTAVTSGSAQTVALTTSGAPSGVTVSLSPASVTAGASSTLTVKTTSAAVAGSYPITIIGTATSGTATAMYTLTVTGTTTGGNVAPGGNFDLSRWELQLPIGSAGAPTTITPAQLEGSKGFQDAYFYTDSTDGSMTFWDPEKGVTTSGSNYPRSELREMTSSGSLAAWSVAGTNVLAVTEKISQVPDHVCISQVHLGTGPTASTKPLFELFYYANGNIVMAIEQTPAGGNEVQHTVGNVPLGTKFSYSVGLTGGNTIDFTMNGKVQTWPLTAAFQKYTMYFKAGDYDQTAGSSTTNGALLHIYALSVTHTS